MKVRCAPNRVPSPHWKTAILAAVVVTWCLSGPALVSVGRSGGAGVPAARSKIATVTALAAVNTLVVIWFYTEIPRKLGKSDRDEESQGRLAAIVASSIDAIVVQDLNGTILHWNASAERLYGYRACEVIGQSITLLAPPDRPDEVPELLKRIARGERLESYETERVRKDGQSVSVSLQMSPIRGTDNAIIGVSSIARDTTQKKRSEAELASAMCELREIVETIPGIFSVFDLENRLVRWNRGLEEATGLTGEELRGRSALAFPVPEDRERLAAGIRQAYMDGSAEMDFQLESRSGPPTTYHWSGVLLHNGEGKVIGLTGVGRSVATERALEASLREQAETAETINRVGRALLAELDFQKLVEEITHAATGLSGARYGVFLSKTDHAAGELFNVCASSGSHWPAFERGEESCCANLLEPIYHGAGPVRVDDLTTDPRFGCACLSRRTPPRQLPVRSYLAVPVVSRRGAVLGAIVLGHERPCKFTDHAEQLVMGMAAQAAVALDNARLVGDLQESRVEMELAYDATIEGWARALDLRDHATEGHSRRVTELTVRLARALNMTEDELTAVKRGALLHDIGKMAIPDRILQKPGPLTDDEWTEMKRHPTYAHAMLAQIRFLGPALDIPYCHHEHWDGSGYPRGLKGKQIPFAARIFAIVDIYDALSSTRPYRPAWPEMRIRQHLQELAGTELDPAIVPAFLRMLDEPPSTTRARPDGSTAATAKKPGADACDRCPRRLDRPNYGLDLCVEQHDAVERVLRERKGWAGLLVEHVSDWLIILEVDGTIRWTSPSVERILGYQPAELVGRTIFSMTHPDDLESAQLAFRNFLPNTGGQVRFSIRSLHKDGGFRHLETVSTNLLDNPAFRGLLVSARDVTERVRAEEALRESERRLQMTILAAGETIFEWTPQNNDTKVWENECGNANLGPLPAGYSNYFDWWRDRIHPDDREPVLQDVQTAISSSASHWSKEYRFLLNDGTYGWMYSYASIVRAEAGRPIRMVGSMIDTTRRKRSEDALRQSQERLQSIMQTADDIIWEWDVATDRLELWWNEQVAQRFDMRMIKETTMAWWLDRMHPDDSAAIQDVIRRNLTSHSRDWSGEYRLRRESGGYTWIHIRSSLLRDEKGQLVRVIGSSRDISDLKELEARLKEELAKATALNQELESKRRELASTNTRLIEMAETDALTGLKNRHQFHQAFDGALAQSARTAQPLSVIMLDVDHFKPYNDTFGHLAGDEVLQKLGALLRQGLRPYDLAARYGGEEFVVVMSDCDSASSRQTAERLRAMIADQDWPLRPITISLGVATTSGTLSRANALLDAADRALYSSKSHGRNCVTHVDDLTDCPDLPRRQQPSQVPGGASQAKMVAGDL